jgi:hypothetical protein
LWISVAELDMVWLILTSETDNDSLNLALGDTVTDFSSD